MKRSQAMHLRCIEGLGFLQRVSSVQHSSNRLSAVYAMKDSCTDTFTCDRQTLPSGISHEKDAIVNRVMAFDGQNAAMGLSYL